MTQGILVRGRYPETKTIVKKAVKSDPASVSLVATSIFGKEYSGPITEMPIGKPAYFVGPNPYNNRRFYGSIIRKQLKNGSIRIVIK